MKKLFTLLLSLAMLFSLAACGGGGEPAPEVQSDSPEVSGEENPPTPAPAQPEQPEQDVPENGDMAWPEPIPESVLGTKTMAWFMEYAADGSYTMQTRYEMEGMTITNLNVYDGGRVYTESDMGGAKSVSILMDDAQYILDPASKTCIKMSIQMAAVQEIVAEEAEHYETALSTGEMDIGGKMYFYEEFSVEGGGVKYCFDGDELKYILSEMEGDTYTMEITLMEKSADQSLFEIPADYTMMEL